MGRGRTERVVVQRHAGGAVASAPDELIVEEPLTIRLDHHLVATTMRTPGHDHELAVGFCLAEGHIGRGDVRTVKYCDGPCGPGDTTYNEVSVDTGGRVPAPVARVGTTTSSCGACGVVDLEVLTARLPRVRTVAVDGTLVAAVLQQVSAPLFDKTGAVHAAAAFDLETGAPVLVREDVGRHNAVDKVVGRLLLDGRLPAARLGLYVSGRASFELVQKAWAAGFPAMVAVSGPTALAVETARTAGMALVGFARDGRHNVYSPDPLAALGGRATP